MRYIALKLSVMAGVAFLLALVAPMSQAQPLVPLTDFSFATVIDYTNSKVNAEKMAACLLVDEVEHRSRIRWQVFRPGTRASARSRVVIGTAAEIGQIASLHPHPAALTAAEGYLVQRTWLDGRDTILVIGADSRGVLFGVGRLLRELRMERDKVSAPADLSIASSPYHAIRGHQLGYRPKTNSYDGWSLPMWEQYFRDLIVFGANSVELIPPRSDDAADSPMFPEPPMRMMEKMSAVLDNYGIDVWVWFPAMDSDYTDAATLKNSLAEWGDVFKRLKRIDAVFVPGGDPGHTEPSVLMGLLAKQSILLQKYHPKAKIWVSPQGFTQAWMDTFLNIVRTQRPIWLGGIVFGPQVKMSLPELRKQVPAHYPIRHYPDITHTVQCQFPVENWDFAFALTEGRECINPRTQAEAVICRYHQADTVGSISYSEGCNDDVNKALWSALEWDPNMDTGQFRREYSRYFIDPRMEESFAEGLWDLEHDWIGRAENNKKIPETLARFQQMEKIASPRNKLNWRFQQALYRAYYDAYVAERARYERSAENRALSALANSGKVGWEAALNAAQAELKSAGTPPGSEALKTRLEVLAEALFQSIHMQLSVTKYFAIGAERGANLDQADILLNDRVWLLKQFQAIRELPDDAARQARIQAIAHWEDAGAGGFYDDLGDAMRRPHLLNADAFETDPGHMSSVRTGYQVGYKGRIRHGRYVETLYDTPLQMRYTGLAPGASYRVRVVYSTDNVGVKLRLDAIGAAHQITAVHDWLLRPAIPEPLEFDVPKAAYASGTLTLSWRREPGLGGNGRGCQVCEVWLMAGGTK